MRPRHSYLESPHSLKRTNVDLCFATNTMAHRNQPWINRALEFTSECQVGLNLRLNQSVSAPHLFICSQRMTRLRVRESRGFVWYRLAGRWQVCQVRRTFPAYWFIDFSLCFANKWRAWGMDEYSKYYEHNTCTKWKIPATRVVDSDGFPCSHKWCRYLVSKWDCSSFMHWLTWQ